MDNPALHTRWRMELPEEQEDSVADWLFEQGASALYRDADPPRCFYAYFPQGVMPPDDSSLSIFDGVSLIEQDSFADEDWLAKSREGFASVEVAHSFFVRPIWDDGPIPAGRIPITVNPGLAFGTGGHETTRLCMQLIECLAQEKALGGSVLDIGAGTGILAFAAHLLGADDVDAFDIDPDCGPAMAEFIQMNSDAARHAKPFSYFVGTLEEVPHEKKYNLLLANILLETNQELMPHILQRLAPGGYLIASGILIASQDEALLSFALGGLRPVKLVSEGEWIAILAKLEA